MYNPEVKKRKRGGYEEGDYTQYKELPASEFIQTTDPIAILGSYNRLTFDQAKNGDVALAALDKMPDTTDEIRICCGDLRVLGRKEFKTLLKWRLQVRDVFGFPSKKTAAAVVSEEVTAVDSMDEETKIQEDLQGLQDKASAKKKREKRRGNERKQKEIVRTQLNMNAPMDIGIEQRRPLGEGAMFALKALDKTEALRRIARGKMALLSAAEQIRIAIAGSGRPKRRMAKAIKRKTVWTGSSTACTTSTGNTRPSPMPNIEQSGPGRTPGRRVGGAVWERKGAGRQR